MTSLEMHLDSHTQFSANSTLKTDLFIDSCQRFVNLEVYLISDILVNYLQSLHAMQRMCHSETIHMVIDSYKEFSIKSTERIRRTSEAGRIDLAVLD